MKKEDMDKPKITSLKEYVRNQKPAKIKPSDLMKMSEKKDSIIIKSIRLIELKK